MNAHSITEALVLAVKALGGSKAVGPRLWPEKTADSAQRLLLDALNEDRPQHLTPEQMLAIARWARQAGHHGVMEYLCAELAYAPPQPVAPADEADQLRRQVLAMGQQLQQALSRLDEIERRPVVRAVA